VSPDIVLDANILGHAGNPTSHFFDSAVSVIQQVLDSDLILQLDDTGKAKPAMETSNLYREYQNCIVPQSLASSFLVAMLLSGRVEFQPRPKRDIWKKCQTHVPRNNGDAIVLGVAVLSESRDLVSNDLNDFSHQVRRDIKRSLRVHIRTSDEWAA
jgi:hypothetical protein